MVWYADGSIQVAANGQVATGTGTAFLKNVRIGDGLTIAGSASMHEVTNIASDTQLTFSPPYTGAAGSGKQYRIAPIQGYVKEAADLLRALTQNLGSFANNANLTALAAAVGAANKGLMFTAPGAIGTFDLSAQGRTFLAAATQAAQQSALGLVPASGPADFTPGRIMTAGYAGLGSSAPSIPANIDDLNNIQFFQGNPNNNNPFGTTGSTGIHLQQASSFGWQLVGPNGGNSLGLKWRNRSAASVWGQWRDVWDSSSLLVGDRSTLTSIADANGAAVPPLDKVRGLFSAYSTTAISSDWNSNIDPGTSDRLMNTADSNGPGFGTLAYCVSYRYSNFSSNGNLTQMAIGYAAGADAPKLALRGRYQGAWSRWAEFWSTDNLAKQASITDTTAGAVLINGAYGLGGPSISRNSVADTNLSRGSEFFINSAPPGSNPFPAPYISGIHCCYGSPASGYGVQFVGGVTAHRYFVRYQNNGTWVASVELWHTGNLTPNKLEDRTQSTLPTASANKGQMFNCTNTTTRGERPVYSDGSVWRRLEDSSLITAA